MKIFLTAAIVTALLTWAGTSVVFAKGGGKEFYSQDYQFNQPMKGYEGQAGNYYCSYQRLPNRVCTTDGSGNERCRVKGWTLRQYCY
ncbi:conserved exported protein of unknown function [Hyphomicrobium sp. 1Nfss2.1]|uniref:hypothetical protein n=1 Tax=unclassified Hyphomicrobium TaxID=2619925 RepID=UPI00093008E9|nr:hypothetical protein [Hyphomicrobium sp. NDB2Meth4]